MSRPSPFFTIGIPTYNRAQYLRSALESALRQSYPHFEVIVSDNASTDETPDVVREFGDARVSYFRQESNIGGIQNTNWLIERAEGDYFVPHQDDDLLHKDFLTRCAEALTGRENVAYFGSSVIHAEDPRDIGAHAIVTVPPWPGDFLIDQVSVVPRELAACAELICTTFVSPAIAFNTRMIQKCPYPVGIKAPDRYVLAALALEGDVIYDSRIGAFYREHAAQASRSGRWSREDNSQALERIIAMLEEKGVDWASGVAELMPNFSATVQTTLIRYAVKYGYPRKLALLIAAPKAELTGTIPEAILAEAEKRSSKRTAAAEMKRWVRRTGRLLLGRD